MSDPTPKKSGYTPRIILMGVLLALLANLVLIAMVSPKPSPEQEDADEAMRWLHEAHAGKPSRAQLAEGAVSGMAEALRDPHTVYMPATEATKWDERLHGEKEVRPLAPGPAEPEHWLIDRDNGIGYVALGRFTDQSAAALALAIGHMRTLAPDRKLGGIILDLRGNPGGFLMQARDAAGLFLPKDSLVASVRGPSIPEKKFRTASEPATDAPLVVLIDENSASAAEVLAGALQEHKRAFVIGTRSFGKGCVQSVKELESLHGKLKITTALYFLPSGRCIHRTGKGDFGVSPSPGGLVETTVAEAKARAATRLLAPSLHPLSDAKAAISPAFLRDQLHDAPLAAAYQALLEKKQSGDWPRVGDDPAPAPKDDPHFRLREEIKTVEARLRQLRRELAAPAPATAQP